MLEIVCCHRCIWYIFYYVFLPQSRRFVGMEQLLSTISRQIARCRRVQHPFALAQKLNFQRRKLLAPGWLAPRRNVKVQPVPDSQSTKWTKRVARNGRNHQLRKNEKLPKPSLLFWVSIFQVNSSNCGWWVLGCMKIHWTGIISGKIKCKEEIAFHCYQAAPQFFFLLFNFMMLSLSRLYKR